jgi:GAF domain-containing protein
VADNLAFEYDALEVRRLDPGELDNLVQPDSGTLVVPVKLRDQFIGVIGLESDDPEHQWTEDDLAIIEATANQAALTVENARLLETTQRQAEREQIMGQIAARVRETLDLDSVLQTTVTEIGRSLNLGQVEIRLGKRSKNNPVSQSTTPQATGDGDNGSAGDADSSGDT